MPANTELTPAPANPAKLTWPLRAILATVLIADVLDLMDATITNIAAPTIVREIGGGESLVKWLGASYALALGVLLVVGGRAGDRYGKRRVFLVGIAGFGLASLACGLAAGPAMLIVARFIQGGFGAFLIPQGIGLLLASFSRAQIPTAVSLFGPVMGVGSILGPILAGFIISADIGGLTWRPMFLINIVLAAIGFACAVRFFPEDTGMKPIRIDLLGSAALAVAMVGLIYGLIEGAESGWGGVAAASLAAGVIAMGLFALRQVRAANPLILPSLLKNRGFTAGLLLGLGYFAAVNGFAYVISLFLQRDLGLTAKNAAFALTPLMLGIIIASLVARPLIAAWGRRLVSAGLGLTLLATAGVFGTVLAAGGGVNPLALAPSVLVLGLGMGACFSSIYDIAIGDVAQDEAGSASGSLSAVQQLAAAIGAATVTTVYFSQAAAHDGARALLVSVVVVAAITVACLGLVRLLPRRAQPEDHQAATSPQAEA
jgi:EmrB/QacA subfamily drug resistance transporter